MVGNSIGIRIFNLFVVGQVLLSWLIPASAMVVRTMPEALRNATPESPIILVRYGADFDAIGQNVYEKLVRFGGLNRISKRSVIIGLPTYQNPTPNQLKELEKLEGKTKLPPAKNYPCIMMLDNHGRLMSEITDAAIMHDARRAAQEIEKRLNDYTAQRKLLEKAKTAFGVHRFELIMQASSYDIKIHEIPAAQSRKARRGVEDVDTIGLKERMEFDPFQVVEQLQAMNHPEADLYIRGMIEDGCYSRIQRQQMMAAYAGHVRRSGGSLERLLALYTEMYHIAPSTQYAQYAESALDLWVFKKEFPIKKLPVEQEPPDMLPEPKTNDK